MKCKASIAASVKARLLDISRARGEDFNLILGRYSLERLLYRLCRSAYADQFVLKGAMLGSARISIQVDIGFGDVVTPHPDILTYPTLLDSPAPRLRCYPRETVVAEKYQAMVHLGLGNSRMKDYYDVWVLANHFDFDGSILGARTLEIELPNNINGQSQDCRKRN